MRNITGILAIFFVLAATVAFTYDDAEAARCNKRVCICTSANGTLYHGCPVHGNGCIGLETHEHENTRGRSTALPIVCKINGQASLWPAPSCRTVRQQFRDRERAIRQQERLVKKRQREEARAQQELQRNMNNIPIISDFQHEIRRENRRIHNEARNEVRREVHNTVRDLYGR